MSIEILLASHNQKKLRELRRILAEQTFSGVTVVGLHDVPEYPETRETGATFEENALLKAHDGAAVSGLPCIADDSGLAVDALNGMPGILSARWCGRHNDDDANNALLLAQLADVPAQRRGARYVSACALVVPGDTGPTETVVRGEWPGTIITEPVGTAGFGYDPIFLPDDTENLTAAQLPPERKDALSHRGRALHELLPAVKALLNSTETAS